MGHRQCAFCAWRRSTSCLAKGGAPRFPIPLWGSAKLSQLFIVLQSLAWRGRKPLSSSSKPWETWGHRAGQPFRVPPVAHITKSPEKSKGMEKKAWSPKSYVWVFVCLGQVSKLGCASFPSRTPSKDLSLPVYANTSLPLAASPPACAFPLPVSGAGETPSCLPCFFRNGYKEGEVY